MGHFVPQAAALYNRGMGASRRHGGLGTTVEPPELEAIPEVLVRPVRRRPGGLPTHLSLPRQVWVVAVWPMLEQMMSSLVGFVDASLAGHLQVESVESTNAVGVASFVTWLMGLFQGAIGVGSTALIARAVGGNHRREANSAVGQSMIIALVWGLMIAVAFYFGSEYLVWLFGLRGREFELCVTYLKLLSLAAPFMSILFIGAACLRGAGDFKAPFYIMVVVNAVNLSVSSWLAIGPEDWGGAMGLRGVAIGTVTAWTVGGMLMLGLLLSRKAGAQLHLHRLRWQPRMTWRLLSIGIPSFWENLIMWGAHAFILKFVNWLGDPNLFGAHTIAIRIEAFSFLPGFAFSLAAATLAGQYLGARDPKTAARAVWICWVYSSAIMTSLGVLFMVVPGWFVWLVTKEQVFTDTVPALLFMAGWSQIGFSTAMVLAGALRGAGDTRVTMRINLWMTVAFRVPLAYWVGLTLGYGLEGIWFVLSLELMFKGAVFAWRFHQGRWKTVQV